MPLVPTCRLSSIYLPPALRYRRMQAVCVGDVIEAHAREGVLRGHGTLLRGESLVASRCGLVQRWNQLVLVDPLAGGYVAAVGHVVVGRVVQVRPGSALPTGAGSAQRGGLVSGSCAHTLF